jgi:hypothetical protein
MRSPDRKFHSRQPNRLTSIVDSQRFGIVAAQGRKRHHDPLFPDEAETGEVSTETAKVFAIRVEVGSLGKTCQFSPLVGAAGVAVQSSQGAEVLKTRLPGPQDRVLVLAGHVRTAAHMALAVDGKSKAGRSAQGAEVGHPVVGKAVWFVFSPFRHAPLGRDRQYRKESGQGTPRQCCGFHNVSFIGTGADEGTKLSSKRNLPYGAIISARSKHDSRDHGGAP